MSSSWRDSELNKLPPPLTLLNSTEAVSMVILLLCRVMFLVLSVQFTRIFRLPEKVKFLGSALYRSGNSSSVYSSGRTERGSRTSLLTWGVGVVRSSHFLMIGIFFFIHSVLACAFSIACCAALVADPKSLPLMKSLS